MGLNAALGELGVQIFSMSRCLVHRCSLLKQLLLSLLKVLKFLLLDDICELLADELKLLLVENVNVLVLIVGVQPLMFEDVMSCGSLLRHFLKHHFDAIDGVSRYRILVLDILIHLFNGVEVPYLISFERHVTI